jgi:hypothetical protein
MSRGLALAAIALTLGFGFMGTPATAAEEQVKGKTCRMEQQCRWQNYKKICIWVKVCR